MAALSAAASAGTSLLARSAHPISPSGRQPRAATFPPIRQSLAGADEANGQAAVEAPGRQAMAPDGR